MAVRRRHSASSVSQSTAVAIPKRACVRRSATLRSGVPSSSAADVPSRRITPHTSALSEHGACIMATAGEADTAASHETRHTCHGTSASCRKSASTKQPTLKPAGRPTPMPATVETATLTVGGFQKGSGAVRVRQQAARNQTRRPSCSAWPTATSTRAAVGLAR